MMHASSLKFSEVHSAEWAAARSAGLDACPPALRLACALRAPAMPGNRTSNESLESDQTLFDSSNSTLVLDSSSGLLNVVSSSSAPQCSSGPEGLVVLHDLAATISCSGSSSSASDNGAPRPQYTQHAKHGARVPGLPHGAAAHHGRSSGYRRLFAAVCAPRAPEGRDQSSQWREVSVEDLIRAVQALPQSAPAGDAVRPGLLYLDSRAYAALLKGLAKAGLGHRATELFDEIRCASRSAAAAGANSFFACMHVRRVSMHGTNTCSGAC